MKKIVENKIRKLLDEAREAKWQAEEKERELYDAINYHFADPDLQSVPTEAENADNLEQAISCYIQYGEYDIDGIIKELDAME